MQNESGESIHLDSCQSLFYIEQQQLCNENVEASGGIEREENEEEEDEK